MKSLLFAAVFALGFLSFADNVSAGDRSRRGSSGHSNYSHSRGYSQHHHRGYAPVRGGYYSNCAPRYHYGRRYSAYSGYPGYGYSGYPAYAGYAAYPGYYGGGVALRVGPVVFRSGSSRGYCRY